MQNKIEINVEIDLGKLEGVIASAKDLNDSQEFFEAMLEVSRAKKQLDDASDLLEAIDRDAKGLINAKAKALYGNDWQVIKGSNYKIGRSYTGSVYEIADASKLKDDFKVVKVTPNTKAIDLFRETSNGKLPEGVAVNEHRGESIRVSIKDENN